MLITESFKPVSSAMSVILNSVEESGNVSRKKMISARSRVQKRLIDDCLDTLCRLHILQQSGTGLGVRYELGSAIQNSQSGCLVLSFGKTTHVSSAGHRSVRVHGAIMALRDGFSEKRCGSIVWKEATAMPKYRLGPVRRFDPQRNDAFADPRFTVDAKRANHLAFRLIFEPPMHTGEVVEYGFYAWVRNHYARTRMEAVQRFNDEWIREGLAVNDPTLHLTMKVRLPQGYEYRKAVVEKDPVLAMDGPNVPGERLFVYEDRLRMLEFTRQEPELGHYFISWIPP